MALFLVRVCFLTAALMWCHAHPSDVRVTTPNRYLRFHENDSYIGQSVPCTEIEKLCFRFNLLYQYVSGSTKCSPLSTVLFFNRTEFFYGSGHLVVAKVNYLDPCTWQQGHRFAYDGVCYKSELVRDVICACGGEADSEHARNPTTTHLFGGQECRCDRTNPTHIAQPEEPGRCLIPNLNFPGAVYAPFTEEQDFSVDVYGSMQVLPPSGLQCNKPQLHCFRMGLVSFGGTCVRLLEQGPCPADHTVVLDVTAAQNGYVETTCVHVRGHCAVGHVRMPIDGRCYSQSELVSLGVTYTVSNQFGMTVVFRNSTSPTPQFVPEVIQGDLCRINVVILFDSGGYAASIPSSGPGSFPECVRTNNEKCELYEVHSEPPEPDT